MCSYKTVWLCIGVLCMTGCGEPPKGTVEGRVIVDGKPLGGFDIRFHAVADGSVAVGAAGLEGQYRLINARSLELKTGEYRVTINPTSEIEGMPMPTVNIPEEIKAASTTTLVKTVESGPNVIDIEVSTR